MDMLREITSVGGMLGLNIEGSAEPFQLGDSLVREMIGDKSELVIEALDRFRESLHQALARLRDEERRTVRRAGFDTDQEVGPHLGEKVTQLKGEWAVLVKKILKPQRNPKTFLQEVAAFLDVCFPCPTLS